MINVESWRNDADRGKTKYLAKSWNDVTSNTTKSIITDLGFKFGSAVRGWRMTD